MLDRIARRGWTFSRAHSTSSWTRPAVASLMTGLYAGEHGAMTPLDGMGDVPTLAEMLKRAGYTTAAFVANPNVVPAFGFDRGFDTFVDVETETRDAKAADVHAHVTTFLQGAPDSLFLYVHTRDPHAPYDAPRPFGDRYPRTGDRAAKLLARYDGEIAYADAEIRRLWRTLEESGLTDDATVAVLSDHGEEFLEHGGLHHGQTLYQEQLLVPFLLRAPGLAGGRIRTDDASIVDLLPTLSELTGGTPPEVSGRSLAGGAAADSARVLFAELTLADSETVSVRRGRYKLVHRIARDGEAQSLLFDLEADPGEREDVSARLPPDELRAQAEAYRAGRRGPSRQVELDEELRERLEALGYLE